MGSLEPLPPSLEWAFLSLSVYDNAQGKPRLLVSLLADFLHKEADRSDCASLPHLPELRDSPSSSVSLRFALVHVARCMPWASRGRPRRLNSDLACVLWVPCGCHKGPRSPQQGPSSDVGVDFRLPLPHCLQMLAAVPPPVSTQSVGLVGPPLLLQILTFYANLRKRKI